MTEETSRAEEPAREQDPEELTDAELEEAAGGIIIVNGQPTTSDLRTKSIRSIGSLNTSTTSP